MQIHQVIRCTRAEGPGVRFALWVQGCSHRCPGCFAEDTWDFRGGEAITLHALIAAYRSVLDRIDGVTLLGGEPFDQAEEVSLFAREVHASGKTLITFTGYDYDRLKESADPSVGIILDCTDILIDGRFDEKLIDFSRPLVGSSNQNIRFLTDRIPVREFYAYRNRFEIRTDASGKIRVNGMGDIRTLEQYLGGKNV